VQPRAVHDERRVAPVAGLDLRAHQPERRRDAVDRPPADRAVAVEHEDAPLLRGQPAGQQPHQRAGVADVDRSAWLARLAQPGAAHDDRAVLVLLDERTDRAQRVERRQRVRRPQVVRDPHRLERHPAEQRGAVRDRLVGRRAQLAAQPPGRREEDAAHVASAG
jgi:hypothetical protein